VLSARPARVPSLPRQAEETAITSIPHPTAPQLTIGVDTHLDVHVAHAADQLGRRVATLQVPTTPAGYQHLLAWARGLGQPVAWGVEGTGSYGAALARFLAANHQVVVESTGPTGRRDAATASPTRWTPRPPPRPCKQATQPSRPRPAPARWR
jgi:Transposase